MHELNIMLSIFLIFFLLDYHVLKKKSFLGIWVLPEKINRNINEWKLALK